jgi:hypothetical protein
MSREHIWGDWLKHHVAVNLPKHSLGTLIVNAPGTRYVSTVHIRAGDPLRSRLHVVCETCNNTWLSAIQETAKPVLIPMFDGKTCVLGHEKQQRLATWISMATMTAEFLLHEKTQISVRKAIVTGCARTTVPWLIGVSGSAITDVTALPSNGFIARFRSTTKPRSSRPVTARNATPNQQHSWWENCSPTS